MFLQIFIIVCLAISIWLLVKRKYLSSAFLLMLFISRGFGLIPERDSGFKFSFAAFIYTIIFFILNHKGIARNYQKNFAFKMLIFFLVFVILSISFSIFYYDFPAFSCISTGLRYFTLLAYVCFYKLSGKSFAKLMRLIFYVTFLASLVFVFEVTTGIQIVCSGDQNLGLEGSSGLYWGISSPILSRFFVYISFFNKEIIPKYFRLASMILFPVVIIFTTSRTAMIAMGFTVLLILYILGSLKKNGKILLIFTLLIVILQPYILPRLHKDGDTSSDMEYVMKGDFSRASYTSENGLTMLYRLAWINERLDYMFKRPTVELLMGLGMINDNEAVVHHKYHFRYGLLTDDGIHTQQLQTGDIAWGNLVTRFGIVGSFIYMIFIVSLVRYSFKYRKNEKLSAILFGMMISLFITSFADNILSDPYAMSCYFVFFGYIKSKLDMKENGKIVTC